MSFGSARGLPGLVVHRRAAALAADVADAAERAAPVETPAAAPVRTRKPELGIRSAAMLTRADEPRITVTWDRASIADVVAGFAAFSGRTIILGKDVKGEVNAEIKNQPWPQAFQAILASQGLSAQEMTGGIIRVDAPSALAALDSLEPLETSIVRINYAQAGSLAKTVESILTKDRGRVVADTGSNALIVTDTRSRIAERQRLRARARHPHAAALDPGQDHLRRPDRHRGAGHQVRPRQPEPVLQQAGPAARPERRPGDVFDKTVNVIDLGGNSVSAIGNADADITGSALDLIYSTSIGGFALTTFLSALERTELADIQAEPVISTLDNRQADILVGEETPVRVIDANSSSSGTARANVQFKETGIRLTVTPHVTNNRQILMQLHTERSAIQPLAAADLGFIFQKQKADNQLLVNDGETAVIGGLTVTQVTKTRVRHPAPGEPADHRQAVQLHQRYGKPARPHYLGHTPDHRRRRLGSVAASRGPSEHPDGNESGASRARSLLPMTRSSEGQTA